jgi:hypothetical protein
LTLGRQDTACPTNKDSFPRTAQADDLGLILLSFCQRPSNERKQNNLKPKPRHVSANGKSAFCIDLVSDFSLALGTTIVYLANSHAEHRAVMETVGGILLIGGLGLMGCALEAVLGAP